MEYVRVGHSGLKVGRIALGCMSFGDPTLGMHSWTLGEEASQPFFSTVVGPERPPLGVIEGRKNAG